MCNRAGHRGFGLRLWNPSTSTSYLGNGTSPRFVTERYWEVIYVPDRSVSVPMTLSDLERRVKLFGRISLITLVPFDVERPNSARGWGTCLRGVMSYHIRDVLRWCRSTLFVIPTTTGRRPTITACQRTYASTGVARIRNWGWPK